jgi:hypothetical protein
MALFAQGSPEIMSQKPSSPFSKNIFIMSEGLTSYFPKLILPIKLSCVYPFVKKIAVF